MTPKEKEIYDDICKLMFGVAPSFLGGVVPGVTSCKDFNLALNKMRELQRCARAKFENLGKLSTTESIRLAKAEGFEMWKPHIDSAQEYSACKHQIPSNTGLCTRTKGHAGSIHARTTHYITINGDYGPGRNSDVVEIWNADFSLHLRFV